MPQSATRGGMGTSPLTLVPLGLGNWGLWSLTL